MAARKTWLNYGIQTLVGLLLVCGTGYLLVTYNVGQSLRRASYDLLFSVSEGEHLPESVIVYLDDYSHRHLEQPYDRTWDRRVHARLLNRLADEGAKLVFYDIIFDTPTDEEADAAFAEAIKRHGNVILAGSYSSNRSFGQEVEEIITAMREFRRHAAGWGLINTARDPDDALRILPLGSDRFPSAAWKAALNIRPDLEDRLGERLDERWLNYTGPPDTIPHISFARALSEEDAKAGYFKGKLVFIGARASVGFSGTAKDTFRSPYRYSSTGQQAAKGRNMFYNGVEIHAMALANLIHGDWFRRVDPALELVIVLGFGLLLVAAMTPSGPGISLVIAPALTVVTGVASVYFAWQTHTFYNWLVPVAVQGPLALFYSLGVHYYFEQRRRSRLRRIFSTYISPEMVRRMADSDEDPELGGQEVEITAFFSDVAGFSEFSEILESQQLVDLMNEYLSAMTDILQQEQGTLDKYIGDAIVGIFGAPLSLKTHAYNACTASLNILARQDALCRKWRGEGERWPPRVGEMRTRIGLNTGLATVGNIGSKLRFNYTMMGDTVNLAARCESSAKYFGVFAMCTEHTRDAALQHKQDIVFRYLDRYVVKGRTQPVSIYEIFGREGDMTEGALVCISNYVQGTGLYLGQAWDEALTCFERSAENEPFQPGRDYGVTTNPSLVMIERCKALKSNPPGRDWDGVYVMKTK